VKLDELKLFAMNLYDALSIGVDLYRMTAVGTTVVILMGD
jgi:hypothetical protein